MRGKVLQGVKTVRIGLTNDVGWGCAIRVAQMLICHAVLRWKEKHYNMAHLIDSETYKNLLLLINDN